MAYTSVMFTLIAILSLVGTSTADHHNYTWCPAVDEGCYCRKKYIVEDYLYCEYLGVRNFIPEFRHSDVVFNELHIRYGTEISTIQKEAFNGICVKELNLQGLKIRRIHKNAFSGLEECVTKLNLDENLIESLPKDAILSLNKLEYIGLHNNLMQALPLLGAAEEEFVHLKYFYLFNNKISELPVQTFRGMQSLIGLKLHSNELMYLRNGLFDSLGELKDLELQHNQLRTLPGNIFSGLSKLSKLDLSHNLIYLLLTESFRGLRNLETLYLDSNLLSEFQNGMFTHISRIKYLRLSHNSANSIVQSTFSRLRNLRILDISYNSITRIESKSFRFMYRLEKLKLMGNRLHNLDFLQGSYLSKLKVLDLHANNISYLMDPDVFKSVPKLQLLELSENSLSNIYPGTFRYLSLLKILKLTDNPLYTIREGVVDHETLEELDVTRCQLRYIDPKAFYSLKNANYIWLDHNELSDIPTRLFNNTEKVRILSITNNHLTRLRREMFKGLKGLQTLNLDYNHLTDVTEYSFQFIGGVTEITLTHNSITELYEHSFNDLKSLLTLDLSQNNITQVNKAFSRFEKIQELNFEGNQFRDMNWFSFFYDTLKNLQKLDLRNCDIKHIYLDGLLMGLRNLSTFELLLSGNPLLCNECDLTWLTWIPFNALHNPAEITCNEPKEFMGKPVVCCLESECLDEKYKNNTRFNALCSAGESGTLAPTQSPEVTSAMSMLEANTSALSANTTAQNAGISDSEGNVTLSDNSSLADASSQDSSSQGSMKEPSEVDSGPVTGQIPLSPSHQSGGILDSSSPQIEVLPLGAKFTSPLPVSAGFTEVSESHENQAHPTVTEVLPIDANNADTTAAATDANAGLNVAADTNSNTTADARKTDDSEHVESKVNNTETVLQTNTDTEHTGAISEAESSAHPYNVTAMDTNNDVSHLIYL